METKKIKVQEDLLPLVGKKQDVLDGVTGFVEHYDFALANSSYEARVQAITTVASICYQSPKSLGSISLFDRLQAESAGLPSSSYEFVPILVHAKGTGGKVSPLVQLMRKAGYSTYGNLHSVKFGEYVCDHSYLLTNLRALIEDVGPEESLKYLNTSEEEIQIIRDNFKVFLFNIDVPTRTQMIRHRVSWQELSRRYVSGKKKEFDFYISKKMETIESEQEVRYFNITPFGEQEVDFETETLINLCVDHYNTAIANGVKPEEARRILPQAMMTQIWGAFQPSQLESFFALRLDKHAQREIRQTAEAMQELLNED